MKRVCFGWTRQKIGAALLALAALILALALASQPLRAQEPLPTVAPAAVTTPTPRPTATTAAPGAAPASPLPLPTPAAVDSDASTAEPASASPGGLLAAYHEFAPAATLTYTVQPDDNLLTAALEMGLDLDAMPCAIAPAFAPTQPLVIGDVLSAPPLGTRCHAVQPGDDVASVAALYALPAAAVAAEPWNALPSVDAPLAADSHLRIPPPPLDAAVSEITTAQLLTASQPLSNTTAGTPTGSTEDAAFLGWLLDQPADRAPFGAVAVTQEVAGSANPACAGVTQPLPRDWPYGSGCFGWPTYGWLTQGHHAAHRAIDIAAPLGTPVTAADRGVVIRAGWNTQGYGNFVIVDHQIDYLTLYAHLSQIFVQPGDVVASGALLGTVGSTGNSTGPHLHFEIRDFGERIDPLSLLAYE